MIRRPPRSTLSSSSAASDVYKRQGYDFRRKHGLFNQLVQVGRKKNARSPTRKYKAIFGQFRAVIRIEIISNLLQKRIHGPTDQGFSFILRKPIMLKFNRTSITTSVSYTHLTLP